MSNLKWLIHKNAEPKAAGLKAKMLDVFDDPLVVRFLRDEREMSKRDIRNLKEDFSSILFDNIVEYVDDLPVVLP